MKPQRSQHLVRLVDANPGWGSFHAERRVQYRHQGKIERTGVSLGFDCPIHPHCRIHVPLLEPLDGGPPISDYFPSGALWNHVETDFATITLSPSIHVLGEPDDCEWHGFIQNGIFSSCGDSR